MDAHRRALEAYDTVIADAISGEERRQTDGAGDQDDPVSGRSIAVTLNPTR
jgi:hypothetical protein